jgi:leucyl aminopeptidase
VSTLKITQAVPRADVLVVAVTPGPQLLTQGLSEELQQRITEDLRRVGCDASPGQVWRIPAPEPLAAQSVVAVGHGEDLAETVGTGLRAAGEVKTVAVAVPNADAETLANICTAAVLGAHAPMFLGNAPRRGPEKVVVTTSAPRGIRSGVLSTVLAETAATILARNLVNTPPGHLPPEAMANAARAELKDLPVKVSVWDMARLQKEGMGGIVGVGQGSSNPPRLVVLEYKPKPARQHLAFVGKGITFDSGGLSLKTAKGMETMKCDMAGAAAVLAATKAIAELGLPIRITAYLACAENMPSGTAQRPGDVLTMRGGKTVEVLNTDAEGRLVMADALVLAAEQKPDAVIDVATLTGAQMVALGTRIAAVMGNDDDLAAHIVEAGRRSGEKFWPMPLPDALRSGLKSQIADLKNTGEPFGAMLYAGLFLKAFVPDEVPWAHLDIAGPAFNETAEFGYTPRGGTGFATRTLVELARRRSR